MNDTDEYLSASQVARLIGCCQDLVYKLRQSGRLPESKNIGTGTTPRWRWSRSAVTEYMSGGTNE